MRKTGARCGQKLWKMTINRIEYVHSFDMFTKRVQMKIMNGLMPSITADSNVSTDMVQNPKIQPM